MTEIIYSRQTHIFNPDKQKSRIFVVGVGSTGSFITLTLAKLGFRDIRVIDFDKVEVENIPNQFYRISDIDKFKVDALKEVVKDYTGVDILVDKTKIDSKFQFDLNMNTIVVLCLDNMETRQLVFEKIKDLPVMLVDTRMGGSGYQIYAYDMNNKEDIKCCDKDMKQATAETVCGEKSVIYTILSIASETCQIVKQIDKGEKHFQRIKREMENLMILGK